MEIINISPTFEPSSDINSQQFHIFKHDDRIEVVSQDDEFVIETASEEQLKERIDKLEILILEKKQKYARIYSDFCRANDAIRKNLLKEIKEYKADANVILRYNLKKIMELRKEANGCENDIYHAKLREYNLKLEIDSLDIEIENLKQKVLELELQQRENKKKHQEEMSFLAMESDRFLQENRCFVDINSSLLFEAEKLLENL